MVESTKRRWALIVAAQGALAALTIGCGQYGGDARLDNLAAPPFGNSGQDFVPVSSVLERRCGNLDCHGSPFRALRIYGKFGLRRPEPRGGPNVPEAQYNFYFTGGIPTTLAEIADNYDSIIALEPVLLSEVVKKEPTTTAELPCPYTLENLATMSPKCLTLVRKPSRIEKHKGGTIWSQGADGDKCLSGWISGDPAYKTACDKDLVAAQ